MKTYESAWFGYLENHQSFCEYVVAEPSRYDFYRDWFMRDFGQWVDGSVWKHIRDFLKNPKREIELYLLLG